MPHAVKAHTTTATSVSKSAEKSRLPTDHHLIVTTSGGIFSWDQQGIKKVFSSSKKGILAAKEAGDGSQLLAVADKHVVVLHDCKRGRQDSWGLNGSEGNVRLLEYTPDGKTLFLSTSLTGAIQRYSILESRLLDSPLNHPSPPTVLAVCSTSHLMISASENPPVIYLKNLTLNTPAVQLHPSASSAPVATASFHPERPNTFLLAFRDGTLAAYDATKVNNRMGSRVDGPTSTSSDNRSGEISRFQRLHRVANIKSVSDPTDASSITTIGSTSVGITGAAFLPGYRSRAVSTGADGRCKIVDFEAGGKILRTWHAQAPITSLSVVHNSQSPAAKVSSDIRQPVRKTLLADNNENSLTSTVIAVGRVDGQVLLFDSVGLRLDQVVVNGLGERIISVEWMKGSSPDALPDAFMPAMTKQIEQGLQSPEIPWIGKERNKEMTHALDLPPSAVFAPSSATPVLPSTLSVQDEVETTVRHIPSAVSHSPISTPQSTYLDLFSPVKQVRSPPAQQLRRSPESNIRTRPRLSSQTFIKTSSPESTPRQTRHETVEDAPQNVSIHPLGTTLDSVSRLRPRKSPLKSARRMSVRSPAKVRKRALSRITPVSNGSHASSPVPATRNGQVLADLRKLRAGHPANGKRGASNLAIFAPYMNRTGVSSLSRTQRQFSTQPDFTALKTQPEELSNTHVTASDKALLNIEVDSESHSSDRDIWLSAGSSDGEQLKRIHDQRRKRKNRLERGSHTKDSHHRDENTEQPAITTCSGALPRNGIHSPNPLNSTKKPDCLSMSDEAMYTAFSNLDGGVFVPSSTVIQNFFPRGSSLSNPSSPQRSPQRSPKRSHVQVWKDGRATQQEPAEKRSERKVVEVQPNAIVRATKRHDAAKEAAFALLGKQVTSKGKALPALPAEPLQSTQPPPATVPSNPQPIQQPVEEEQPHSSECKTLQCPGCKATEKKVRSLEEEVARLKAEVLGLKSVVRKAGVGSIVKERMERGKAEKAGGARSGGRDTSLSARGGRRI